MGRVLIFTYIITVLLIAGFSRAEASNTIEKEVLVDKFTLDFETYALHIQGQISTECDAPPQPKFIPINDTTFKLVVVTQQKSICTERIDGYYDVVFDIRAELNKNKIDFSEGLVVKLMDTHMIIEQNHFYGESPEINKTLQGTLVRAGEKYFIQSESGHFELKFIDPMDKVEIDVYEGKLVKILGFAVLAKPLEDNSLPGILTSKAPKAPEVFVTSISLAANP